jgi:glycosyltransferase involved in cell wall biosynthesis
MSGRLRLAHLVSHPIQYFVPLYRELSARPEVDLTVYFFSDASLREYYDPGFGRLVRWDTPLADGYRWRVLPSAKGLSGASPDRRWHRDVCLELLARRYDAVWVHGYANPAAWGAAMAARLSGAALLLREEQTLIHRRPLHRRLATRAIMHTVFGQAFGLYVGEQNRRWLRHHGLPDDRLFPARYCVDNRLFQDRAARLGPRREELRRELGIDDAAPVVLFCGKLSDKKQPLLLLEAYRRIREEHPCWLLVAGDGPLRAAVEATVQRLSIPGVRMLGFVNQSRMPVAYTAADLLVLPSTLHETWGLVVNEAMNFGLPVVASDKVGCAEDLVQTGRNGFTVPSGNADDLANAIATLVADGDLRCSLGERSRRLVADYSIQACADGIVTACLAGVSRRSDATIGSGRS